MAVLIGGAFESFSGIVTHDVLAPYHVASCQVPGNKHKHTFVSPGSKCRWPQKATRIVLDLVRNAESNAEVRNDRIGARTILVVNRDFV